MMLIATRRVLVNVSRDIGTVLALSLGRKSPTNRLMYLGYRTLLGIVNCKIGSERLRKMELDGRMVIAKDSQLRSKLENNWYVVLLYAFNR